MEQRLTKKWLLLNAAMFAAFALFVLIPEVINSAIEAQQTTQMTLKQTEANGQPKQLKPSFNTTFLFVIVGFLTAIGLIVIGIFFIMERDEHLRRTHPWNAILTLIYYFLHALLFGCVSLILVQIRNEIGPLNSANFLAAGCLTAWFASLSFVFLAVFCLLHFCSGTQLGGCTSIAIGSYIFLLTFVPLHFIFTLLLFYGNQKAKIHSLLYWIIFVFFILFGLLINYSLKSAAERIRKCIAKVEEKGNEANIYDVIYQRPGMINERK